MEITVKRFPTGYYHISGEGVCDWSQPPRWPCGDCVEYGSIREVRALANALLKERGV